MQHTTLFKEIKSNFGGKFKFNISLLFGCRGGQFEINDQIYKLAINNGPNHLHGGLKGFSHRLWTTKEIGTNYIVFEYLSVDGEEGYPSTVRVTTTYRLLDNPDRLIVEFDGVNEGQKITPLNLTNHAYFNLGGVDQSILNIGDHRLTVFSDTYLPTDDNGLVTGQVLSVDGTVFDLRSSAMLADRFDRLLPRLGYDNHFCNRSTDQPKPLAKLSCPRTGVNMSVSSTQPGLQIYTAQFMNVQGGKYGRSYGKHSGIAMETQHYPDSVNNPNFPPIWLGPGEKYREVTIYEFSDE